MFSFKTIAVPWWDFIKNELDREILEGGWEVGKVQNRNLPQLSIYWIVVVIMY